MSTFYCVECNHECEERACPLCESKTEALEVRDDPMLGQMPGYSYSYDSED